MDLHDFADVAMNYDYYLPVVAKDSFYLDSFEEFHLTVGGVLTFNHFQPHPAVQAGQMKASPDEYYFRSEYTIREGKKERILNSFTYVKAVKKSEILICVSVIEYFRMERRDTKQ